MYAYWKFLLDTVRRATGCSEAPGDDGRNDVCRYMSVTIIFESQYMNLVLPTFCNISSLESFARISLLFCILSSMVYSGVHRIYYPVQRFAT